MRKIPSPTPSLNPRDKSEMGRMCVIDSERVSFHQLTSQNNIASEEKMREKALQKEKRIEEKRIEKEARELARQNAKVIFEWECALI